RLRAVAPGTARRRGRGLRAHATRRWAAPVNVHRCRPGSDALPEARVSETPRRPPRRRRRRRSIDRAWRGTLTPRDSREPRAKTAARGPRRGVCPSATRGFWVLRRFRLVIVAP